MFVVTLAYVADLEAIDAAMSEHMAYLSRQYADGVFVVSGRQIPRRGGVIIADGLSRADLEARLEQDPFVAQGLVDVGIVEFRASQVAPALKGLLGQ